MKRVRAALIGLAMFHAASPAWGQTPAAPLFFQGSVFQEKTAPPSWAQLPPHTFSHSRQFVVVEHSGAETPPWRRRPEPEAGMLQLNARFLAPSCERIKQAVLRFLGASDRWEGRIRVILLKGRRGQNVRLETVFYADGPQYLLALPEWIQSDQLVRSVVHAVLTERANRHSGVRSAEIPLWLTEGLTRHLELETGLDLVISIPTDEERSVLSQSPFVMTIPQRGETKEFIRENPADTSANYLRWHEPQTFQDLSLTRPDELRGEKLRTFQAAAHVFLNELAALDSGRRKINAMIARLTAHWNWQTAFYESFHQHMSNAREAEMWWSVVLASLNQSNPGRQLTVQASLQKLDEALKSPVRRHDDPDSLPAHQELTLRQIVESWDYERQKPMIQSCVHQLRLLSFTIHPSYASLVDAYKRALTEYLEKRDEARRPRRFPNEPKPQTGPTLQTLLERLAALDQLRNQL